MLRKLTYIFLCAVGIALCLPSCHSVEEWDNNGRGNFDALWQIIDEHYCFFEEKGINWDSIYDVYNQRLIDEAKDNKLSTVSFYGICADMLDELKDGHVNLVTPFATSYYKKWWSDYPQNFNERLVEQYYMHFRGLKRSGLTYGLFVEPDTIGYMRYDAFSSMGEVTLDWALSLLQSSKGLIIDVRDNGGGTISTVETFVRRFIDKRICAGYIQHKTGPGHNDFSEPYAYYYDPTDRVRYDKPIVILTNRSTFSAANNFVSIMRLQPQVTVIGDRTGGGSGMPFSSEIPIGWAVRFSGSPVYDANMQSTEFGIDPDIHVDMTPEEMLEGKDAIIDAAIQHLLSL